MCSPEMFAARTRRDLLGHPIESTVTGGPSLYQMAIPNCEFYLVTTIGEVTKLLR
jgi:hypothetical protein